MNNPIRHIAILASVLMAMLLTTGCHSDGEAATTEDTTPISLAATVYGAATRSGSAGCIDYSVLARSTYGFGVYAYGTKQWVNMQVTYQGSESDPVANLEDVHMHPGNWFYDTEEDWKSTDNISFLAYAPYVSAGSGSTGITSLSASDVDNTTIGYGVASSLSESVDLLWGVKGTTGKPWLNTTLSMTGGPVIFTFHHALAAIGFHVQAMIDKDNKDTDFEDESNVDGILGSLAKVTIESVTITGPFYTSGSLNLNNDTKDTPKWTKSPATPSSTEMTLSVANGDIAQAYRHPTSITSSSTSSEIKAGIINSGTVTGVTQDAQQLLLAKDGTIERCFFAIPNEAQDYTVTLNWYVSGLSTSGSYLAKRHTSTMTIKGLQLKHDTKYYLNFIIGLRTVQLSVTATDWADVEQPVVVTIEHGTSANSSLAPRR